MLLHVLILEIEQEGKLSLEQESITISRVFHLAQSPRFYFRAHTAQISSLVFLRLFKQELTINYQVGDFNFANLGHKLKPRRSARCCFSVKSQLADIRVMIFYCFILS